MYNLDMKIRIALAVTTIATLTMIAQEVKKPEDAPKVANAAAPASTPKPTPPTEEERQKFRDLRIEAADLQMGIQQQELNIKAATEQLAKDKTEKLGPKQQALYQLFQSLNSKCGAVKAGQVADQKTGQCIDPPKENK